MFFEGTSVKRKIKNVNQELLELNGELDNETAKRTFVEFLKSNPTYAARLLLGIKLYPWQHAFVKAVEKKNFGCFVLSRGFGKCLSFNALVPTDKGLKQIQHVEIGDKVLAEKSMQTVLNKWRNPENDGFKLETNKGSIIQGIIGHKTLVFTPQTCSLDFKNIEDIQVGDYVVGKLGGATFPDYSLEDKAKEWKWIKGGTSRDIIVDGVRGESLAYLMGLITGDGHFAGSKRGVVGITSFDHEIIDFIDNLSDKFNFIEEPKRSYVRASRSTQLCSFLEHMGMVGNISSKKTIPSSIFEVNLKEVGSYLSGLYDCDGWVQISNNRKKTAIIGFCSSSRDLLNEMKVIMQGMGIESSISKTFNAGPMKFPNQKTYQCKDAWDLHITGYDNIKLFSELIGFRIKRKQERVDEYLYTHVSLGKQVLIPELGRFLRGLSSKYKHVKSSLFGYKHGYGFFPTLSNNLSESRAKQLLPYLIDKEKELVSRVIDNNLIFEKVVSKTPERMVTYDITVDKEECYVGNGIIHHNSFSSAIAIALYAVFNPGLKIAILAPSWRQSKFIFKTIEGFANSPSGIFFNQCIGGRISKGADAWVMTIGSTEVYSIPLGDGGKIRGYRFNMIFIDEGLLMTENIVNEVIRPFLNVKSDPQLRLSFQKAIEELKGTDKEVPEEEVEELGFPNQKMMVLSSASYTFEYLYKMMKDYMDSVTSPDSTPENCSKTVFQLSYRVAPEGLLSLDQIEEAKKSMSAAQFGREYEAQFSDDAASFYSPKKLHEATYDYDKDKDNCIFPRLIGNPDKKYILAIDPNYNDSETSDHFAMCVIEIDEENRFGTVVHQYALSKSNITHRSNYILYLLQYFNIVYIIVDNAGGQKFIKDLNETQAFIEAGMKLDFFDADFDNDKDHRLGIRNSKKSYNFVERKICHSQVFNSRWISRANEELQNSLEWKKIRFAAQSYTDNVFKMLKSQSIPISKLFFEDEKIDDEASSLQERQCMLIERQSFLIKLVKDECAMIEISITANGSQSFDLPKNIKNKGGAAKPRKDSYTALLLGNYALRNYFLMEDPELDKVTKNRFIPFGFS